MPKQQNFITIKSYDKRCNALIERLCVLAGYDGFCAFSLSDSEKPHISVCAYAGETKHDYAFHVPLRMGAVMDAIGSIVHFAREADIKIGPYLFIPRQMILRETLDNTADDNSTRDIKLTDIEKNILLHLANAHDHSMKRDDLLREVWGMKAALETHRAETHIYRLRCKIEKDPAAPDLLQTIEGGYRLNI